MGKIIALCTSEKKGTAKKQIETVEVIENHGFAGDAHAGPWHRQISLLSLSKIDLFKAKGAIINYGCFGENIVAEGFDFAALPVGTRFKIGTVCLEMSQIGKECHTHCQIYHTMGECIMPTQGVFAKALSGGTISVGDEIEIVQG